MATAATTIKSYPIMQTSEATFTVNLASIANGAILATELTHTGAALGDFVQVSLGVDIADLNISAQVTAADTVTVVLTNNTGGAVDLASQTIRTLITKKQS